MIENWYRHVITCLISKTHSSNSVGVCSGLATNSSSSDEGKGEFEHTVL